MIEFFKKKKFKRLLIKLLELAKNLPHRDDVKLDELIRKTEMLIRRIYSEQSSHLKSLRDIWFIPCSSLANEKEHDEAWKSGKAYIINLINTLVEEIIHFKIANKTTSTTLGNQKISFFSKYFYPIIVSIISSIIFPLLVSKAINPSLSFKLFESRNNNVKDYFVKLNVNSWYNLSSKSLDNIAIELQFNNTKDIKIKHNLINYSTNINEKLMKIDITHLEIDAKRFILVTCKTNQFIKTNGSYQSCYSIREPSKSENIHILRADTEVEKEINNLKVETKGENIVIK